MFDERAQFAGLEYLHLSPTYNIVRRTPDAIMCKVNRQSAVFLDLFKHAGNFAGRFEVNYRCGSNRDARVMIPFFVTLRIHRKKPETDGSKLNLYARFISTDVASRKKKCLKS